MFKNIVWFYLFLLLRFLWIKYYMNANIYVVSGESLNITNNSILIKDDSLTKIKYLWGRKKKLSLKVGGEWDPNYK